jgi:hypothetical protein
MYSRLGWHNPKKELGDLCLWGNPYYGVGDPGISRRQQAQLFARVDGVSSFVNKLINETWPVFS